MEKDKAGKNKIANSDAMIFNFISGQPLAETRGAILKLLAKQGIAHEVEDIVNESAYRLRFFYEGRRLSSYRLTLQPWANDEMTHIQLFKNPDRHREIRFMMGLRFVFGIILYLSVLAIFARGLPPAFSAYSRGIGGYIAGVVLYTINFGKDLHTNREQKYQEERQEDKLMDAIEERLGSDEADEAALALELATSNQVAQRF